MLGDRQLAHRPADTRADRLDVGHVAHGAPMSRPTHSVAAENRADMLGYAFVT
jgi:hypothetical protein